MPVVGEMGVWNGWAWDRLTAMDPETYGLPKPLGWEPAVPALPDDDGGTDPLDQELLEILLCPECDMELGADVCGPRHAYLADHPMEHRLLHPILKRYLKVVQRTEGRLCTTCSFNGAEVVLATGTCKHVDVREDQVTMSKTAWTVLVAEVAVAREAMATIEDEAAEAAAKRDKGEI